MPDIDAECKCCGTDFGSHRSTDYACPVIRGNAIAFGVKEYRDDQVFEPVTETIN